MLPTLRPMLTLVSEGDATCALRGNCRPCSSLVPFLHLAVLLSLRVSVWVGLRVSQARQSIVLYMVVDALLEDLRVGIHRCILLLLLLLYRLWAMSLLCGLL